MTAKLYFKALFGKEFIRGAEDVINYGLNYGYEILRSQISKSICARGLNPSLGIIHRGYTNYFNLSDDIIEVFRPIIDNYVYVNMKDAYIFKQQHKIDLVKSTLNDAFICGKKQTIYNTIDIYIDSIIKAFEYNDETLFEEVNLQYGI